MNMMNILDYDKKRFQNNFTIIELVLVCCLYVCVRAYVFARARVCLCVCVCVHVCVRAYVCMYVCTLYFTS